MPRQTYLLALSQLAIQSLESSTWIIDITKNTFTPFCYCRIILIRYFKISFELRTARCWSNVLLIKRLVLSGNSGGSLAYHRGMPFTTKDQDNGNKGDHNCAIQYEGAWWYDDCHRSNLNGLYLRGNHSSFANGVNWFHWKGYYYSLKRTEMKIRPADFWTVMFMAQQWYSTTSTKKTSFSIKSIQHVIITLKLELSEMLFRFFLLLCACFSK